jgi:hypothetical protein
MAVAVLLDLPGVTPEIYDAVVEEMNLGGRPPEGATYHVAGPTEGGFRVVDVWESREQFEQFARDHISPLMQKHGAQSRPNITIWDVHNELK